MPSAATGQGGAACWAGGQQATHKQDPATQGGRCSWVQTAHHVPGQAICTCHRTEERLTPGHAAQQWEGQHPAPTSSWWPPHPHLLSGLQGTAHRTGTHPLSSGGIAPAGGLHAGCWPRSEDWPWLLSHTLVFHGRANRRLGWGLALVPAVVKVSQQHICLGSRGLQLLLGHGVAHPQEAGEWGWGNTGLRRGGFPREGSRRAGKGTAGLSLGHEGVGAALIGVVGLSLGYQQLLGVHKGDAHYQH